MCGIAGIFNKDKSTVESASIKRMTDAMPHRGPDADGVFCNGNVGLGHRRLSIIDLSVEANQPFSDTAGRYKIVFNGEIYNFAEVKSKCSGYPFRTNGDTEALLAAYEKYGMGCLDLLKGMFAFALWDTQKQELLLVRDRMGVKPLYYYVDNTRLVFSSEIRPLLKSGFVPHEMSYDAVLDFFSFQSMGTGGTIVKGITNVPPGGFIRISTTSFETGLYWDITKTKEEFDFSDEKLVQKKVFSLLTNAVQRRMVSDVPIGAFLSGGIDSSAVVALMALSGQGKPNTFTIGFNEKDYDESEYANIVAKKFNTNHNQVLLDPKVFLDDLRAGLDAMDSPSGDGINTYVVSKAIKKSGLIVALSGVGGDELFAGYPFFRQYLKLKKLAPYWNSTGLLRRMMAPMIASGKSAKAERMRSILTAKENSITGFYPEFRRIIPKSHLSHLIKCDNGFETSLEFELKEIGSSIERFPFLSQVSIAEYMGYTQQTLLRDTDQMGMAVSLEIREPFFDHDLISFILQIPDKWKLGNSPKKLLVESMGDLLPPEIVNRPKKGFLFPWEYWLKTELKDFCEEHINNISHRDFIHGDMLKANWKNFLKGDATVRWMEIWLFVILDYWMQKNEM